MNSKELIYDAWAPAASPWSPWAKPVLFTVLPVSPDGADPLPPVPVGWAPPADGSTALVVNLPGSAGVSAAVALAARGYRPVPLYNAVPATSPGSLFAGFSTRQSAVNVLAIARALQAGATLLARQPPADAAPPAFLLDHNRVGTGSAPPPNWFDNRSVSFTTDFPSASFLKSRGVHRVVVVQPDHVIAHDLAHTLRRWQDAGLTLELLVPGSDGDLCQPLTVAKPGWFGLAFQRVFIAMGLRRHAAGGFGGWVPEPSSAG